METERWTMVELVARVVAALDGATYAGAPNGRVRDVPDARAIRWYATIGLVDRPAAMRGRTALYGPRHLLQLVAIKRRQAEGRSIAEIQAELAGAPDETLREIAGIPERTPATVSEEITSFQGPAGRPRFWAASVPVAADIEPPGHVDQETWPVPDFERGPALDRAPVTEPAPVPEAASVPEPASVPETAPVPFPEAVGTGRLLTGIPLGGGAVLLLPSAPRKTDLAAIAAAAAPLIDLLVARDLVVEFDPQLLSGHSGFLADPEHGTTVPIDQSTDSRTDVTR